MDQDIMKYVPLSKRDTISKAYRAQGGYVIILKDGWEASRTDAGCQVIHEYTISDLRYQIGGIKPLEATQAATALVSAR